MVPHDASNMVRPGDRPVLNRLLDARVHPDTLEDVRLHTTFLTVEQRLILLANHCAEPHFTHVITHAADEASHWLHKFERGPVRR
jgi:hypothetical protein